ncbi:hypothetical protein DACRYDRAFT_22084 [Dacryopinax primogenitus]|uniref:HTH TFE/IIEalpha-type domain-containing protein n=1 Tax=Dacryopinax primogenitus (strain DJM 731) TaxID=1858805 RepID=M5GDJ0_DACPD|nr:uncharacterized protein DACRYDRAFT_22084 [Dacryopinax primogenitus]EJU02443.1 hypothetical protein DACRYDRAFT_22084 [Dacryopinax primogenitus]
MASADDKAALRLLVQHVSRAFYDSKFVVILDQLAHQDVLKDDELAHRVGMPSKDVQKLIAKLEADKLVKVHRRNEIQREGQRPMNKGYCYIDYSSFCNVVKWRITTMRSQIDNKLRNELDNQGYICPYCHKYYAPLDVMHLLDPSGSSFICEVCRHELINNENAESVQGSKDRLQRFMAQTRWIIEDLQKTDEITIPRLNVQQWLAEHAVAKLETDADGLAIAGEGSTAQSTHVQIQMSLDQDDAQVKKAREEVAVAQRQHNALPEWHLKSTISGALTSLGAASARSTTSTAAAVQVNGNADRKPEQNEVYASDLDRYYASLNTSASESVNRSPETHGGEDDDDDFEEIEFMEFPASGSVSGNGTMPSSPAANGLSGMNGSGKRGREEDAHGLSNGRPAKQARMEGTADAANVAEEDEDEDDFEEVA